MLNPVNSESTNIAAIPNKPLAAGIPLEKSVTDLSPDLNIAIHIAPVAVDEVLKSLLFFRQLSNDFSEAISSYCGYSIKQLRWFAPDVKTILDEMSKVTSFGKVVAGVPDLSAASTRKIEQLNAKQYAPQAQQIFDNAQSIIKFFEQMKTLFPEMSEEDFEKKVFKSYYINSTSGRREISGLKEVIEALVELNPVTISTEKKSSAQRTKEFMKPIVGNQASRVVLSHFADLLEFHGNEQNAEPAIEFAKSLRSSLKLTDKEEATWRKVSPNKDSGDGRIESIRKMSRDELLQGSFRL